MNKHKQNGSIHLIFALVITISLVSAAGWWVWSRNSTNKSEQTDTNSSSVKTATTENVVKAKEPDSADTLSSPTKVTGQDTKTYFVYGAPAGQNNANPKKIIISLPGHGTTADDGYSAWKNHIIGGSYALAEFNWWKGTGEKTTDYYTPAEVASQVHSFLKTQNYTSSDTVVLHGFSRGSANTYAVIVQDKLSPDDVFDAVISNAGKYQADFPLSDKKLSDAEITKLYKNIPWVLACGGKDPNPTRDGCPGMAETESFLVAHGAKVLATLTDPNGGHGAFHMSSLGLPKQAFQLIDNALK